MSIHNLAVLMTSFNRRESTLASLKSLFSQQTPSDLQIFVILVDDGSTDGTADAVRSLFPQVRILHGDGTLYWNGGMRRAFETALLESFDAYLLLNDDTILYKDAVARVVACATAQHRSGTPAIMVGSIRSHTGEHSYGGISRRAHGLTIKFEKVLPHSSSVVKCDTMNANFTLIPKEVAAVIGNLESRFRHQFGDLDYGLRASVAGLKVVLIPGYTGECNPNSSAGTWRDPSIALARRWKHLTSPKGVPFNEWSFFTRRHYGWRWPMYAVSPYLKTIGSSLMSRKTIQSRGEMALPQR